MRALRLKFIYCACTVVWKIFVWNYFVVERIIFMAYQYPQKYFNNDGNRKASAIALL